MPLPVESLNENSHQQQIQEAIAASIEQCMREGTKTQKECAGMVYGMARQNSGKALDIGR